MQDDSSSATELATGPSSKASVSLRSGDRGPLRFLTCGSVDDGKSTLIGRLLYDARAVPEDTLLQLERDSRRIGRTGEELDFSLLVDGLEAEREQGITLDVAYRYFATARRSFIIADTPGHEQYTRNMATGASVSDVAVILVDARLGVLPQTLRHLWIVRLLGIQKVVLAVNKMDLIGQGQTTFDNISSAFSVAAEKLGGCEILAIPISARSGANIARKADELPWYQGPTLLEYLETVELGASDNTTAFRFPVQWVNRPDLNFRGLSGTLAAGRLAVGDNVAVLPSGQSSRVERIVLGGEDLVAAHRGDAITVVLADHIDARRGDVLAPPSSPPLIAEQFSAHVIWMGEEPLIPGRKYLLQIGHQSVTATIANLKYKINFDTLSEAPARTLLINDIGLADISTDTPVVFDAFEKNSTTGAFILIERYTNSTVAAGLIRFDLRRATNVRWQLLDIDKPARARLKGQRPCCIWFTGLSGAGKSTIANLVEKKLHAAGYHTYILDGDNVRHGLNRDLGFSEADRVENIRRMAHVAKLMVDAGLISLVSCISPFASDRQMARELMEAGEFIEVYVSTSLEACEARDSKGLYARARAGLIPNFTGVSSPYQPPVSPDVTVVGSDGAPDEEAEKIFHHMRKHGYVI